MTELLKQPQYSPLPVGLLTPFCGPVPVDHRRCPAERVRGTLLLETLHQPHDLMAELQDKLDLIDET